MNANPKFLAATAHVDEAAVHPLPNSRKIYVQGSQPDIRVPQLSDPDEALKLKYAYRESDLKRHLVNEAALKDDDLENDSKPDPRFTQTADELKKEGIEDFQLHYALQTLERTANVRTARR